MVRPALVMPVSPGDFIRSVFTLGIAQLLSWVGGAALAVFLPRYLATPISAKSRLDLPLSPWLD